ncbi:hypothetical protein N566_23630, partial [Streptomycetaceae bacterium MP113-05]
MGADVGPPAHAAPGPAGRDERRPEPDVPGDDASCAGAARETDEDLTAPWLSAASASTEGLRGAQPFSASVPASEDDLAPPWLLRPLQPSAAEDAGAAGRLSEMMRTRRRPASEGGADDSEEPGAGAGAGTGGGREAEAPDDGLLPAWLTRAVRRVGPDSARVDEGVRPAGGRPDETFDADDDLAAPWVPRVPSRPRPEGPVPVAGPAVAGPGTTARPGAGAPPGSLAPAPVPVPVPVPESVAGCARVGGTGASHTGVRHTGEEAPVDDAPHPSDAGGPSVRPFTGPSRPPARTDVPWEEAQRIAARAAEPAAAVTVPLDGAVRQVLAAPVEALADLPSFDTSAMDGWAVAGPGPWTPVGPPEARGVLAGGGACGPLADGCAVRIATGARVPAGTTAVLRGERADLRGARLHLAADAPPGSAQPGTDIRPRGQECRAGARLLPAGTPVTPPVLGLAAAAGHDRLTVVPRPRVEVLVLGDELLPGGLPSDGRVRDALGPMIGPWLAALGAEVLVTRRLGDDADALLEAVTATGADLVVTTGGTAHGPADHVRPVLRRIGAQLPVDGV